VAQFDELLALFARVFGGESGVVCARTTSLLED